MGKEVTEIIIEFATTIVEQKSEIQRLKDRITDLHEQCDKLYAQLKYKEQRLDIGPSYEQMENALLTEQEENSNLLKQCSEKDATITQLRLELEEIKTAYNELTVPHKDMEAEIKAQLRIPEIKTVGEPTTVDTDHYCADCRHSVLRADELYCALHEEKRYLNSFACECWNRKVKKKKLPEKT